MTWLVCGMCESEKEFCLVRSSFTFLSECISICLIWMFCSYMYVCVHNAVTTQLSKVQYRFKSSTWDYYK
jgi:hypothetical protein